MGQILRAPRHPYTRALLDAVPRIGASAGALAAIPGSMPRPGELPPGCAFHPRCPVAIEHCRTVRPELKGSMHAAACHRSDELLPANLGVNRGERSQSLERLVNAFRRTG